MQTIQDGHPEETVPRLDFVDRADRPLPLSFIFLTAFLVHGPLLLMQLPLRSYDTNFHIFFASHYAQHWFDPWNTKWYAGFSQTTYPPLPQQWIAAISHIVGLDTGYMIVQFIGVLLLALGVYRFASLWVDRRAASYAALASIFIGSEMFLVYAAGQLATTCAAPLYLNALPYIYEWIRGKNWRSFLKGTSLAVAAAAAHHATLLFGSFFFALPVLALAIYDLRHDHREDHGAYAKGFIFRTVFVTAAIGVLIAIVLLPFWLALIKYPVTQVPDSSSQPRELHFESGVGVQLLHRSVWGDDPRLSVHRDSRRFDSAAASPSDWFLGRFAAWTWINHARRPNPPGSRLRSVDDGALQLLGNASRLAFHWIAGEELVDRASLAPCRRHGSCGWADQRRSGRLGDCTGQLPWKISRSIRWPRG